MQQIVKTQIVLTVYIMIAAAIVFFAPHKYATWSVGFLVFGIFGLWRIRRSV